MKSKIPDSIYIPREQLEEAYKILDLNESTKLTTFIWPHLGQVEELDLIKIKIKENSEG